MPFKIAAPYAQKSVAKFGGLYTEADPRNLPEGASPLCLDVDFLISSVASRPGLSNPVTAFKNAGGSPVVPGLVEWMHSAEDVAINTGPEPQTLMQDSSGALSVELPASSPGIFQQIYTGIVNAARAISDTIFNREYIALSDLVSGSDQPRQWDGANLDRVSQVGPGAGPSPAVQSQQSANTFPILASPNGLVQPWPLATIWAVNWSAGDWAGHDSGPGMLITFQAAPNQTPNPFVGIQAGDLIYVSGVPLMGAGLPEGQGSNPNGTYVVINTGTWAGGGGPQFIVQVQSQTVNNKLIGGPLTGATLQKTQALVKLSNPVPLALNVAVGSSIDVVGAGVPAWNGTWVVTDTPTEGDLDITGTSLTSNVATYDYDTRSGQSPGWQPNTPETVGAQIVDPNGHGWECTVPGITGASIAFPSAPAEGATISDNGVSWTFHASISVPVTVFNTANGQGIFNVQNAIITSATLGTGSSGSFTVANFHGNVTSGAESGQAESGSGSVFAFDPGSVTLGTGNPGNNPIFGQSGGGFLLIEAPSVAAGQRYAVLLFLTRNSFLTPASPPVALFTDENTQTLAFNNLAIGPPNVVGRVVAITAANAGIGGPYYWIPEDVVLNNQALGQTVTYNRTIVPDNTSSSLTLANFSDTVLLASQNITAVGQNNMELRELGECVKVVEFAGRNFYLGERVKVDNFRNLTFDGGTIGGFPAGWTLASGTAPVIQPSIIFGDSCAFGAVAGTLSQPAYQDAFLAPIIQANTKYSVRVTAFSNGSPASLTIQLVDGANVYAFSPAVTGAMTEFIGAFGNPLWQTVPADLIIEVIGQNVVVDRIEVFPAEEPVYASQVIGSYVLNPEAVDPVTGTVDASEFTSNPLTNEFRFLDTFYLTTKTRTFAVAATPEEPGAWNIREISNAVGSIGPLASDVGEEYVVMADQRGLYIFDGGNHIKISQEIQQLWDSIYWPSGKTIWVKNDLHQQRMLVGVPLPTPNQWMPNAPANATPATPNVVLMLSYLGAADAQGFSSPAVHVTMFGGNLMWWDMRRKWTIWQISAAIGQFISRSLGQPGEQLWLGQAAIISLLDSTVHTDNGAAIIPVYTTYSFSDLTTEQQLQLGSVRKLYPYASVTVGGAGKLNATLIPENLSIPASYRFTQTGFPLSSPEEDDVNMPFNATGNRMFVQFTTDGAAGSWFSIRRIVMAIMQDPRIPIRGY